MLKKEDILKLLGEGRYKKGHLKCMQNVTQLPEMSHNT